MILYEGPSLLDPSVDIVVVATEDSNPKTGRMLYTWILRADRAPEVAAYDGSDDAICGDCKFRAGPTGILRQYPGLKNPILIDRKGTRTCYVRLSPAEGADENLPPSEVWHLWKAGYFGWGPGETSPKADFYQTSEGLNGYDGPLPVRIGSYGDPAAVPTRVWAELLRYVTHWTGYTHMWQPVQCDPCDPNYCLKCDGEGVVDRCDPDLKKYCMASVDTPEERAEAQALGWRTFFVVPEDGQKAVNAVWDRFPSRRDILCPATDPHPKRNATCSTCLLCRGTSAPAPSIWEVAHGTNKENHKWTS